MPQTSDDLQTYLSIPAGHDLSDVSAKLAEADACLALSEGSTPPDGAWLEKLKALCHEHDVALLVQDLMALVQDHGLDGLHLSAAADVSAARASLGEDFIVGTYCQDRHSAMVAGEAGADYIMFLDPNGPGQADKELIDWWMEMMELPCIGSQAEPGDFQLIPV